MAFEKLSGIRPPWEAKAAREAGLETLERAIELCWRVAKEIEDPALAAEMAAVAYLSRARRSMALREPRDRKREILTEGIEVVRGFHHDRDPALILLLKQSAFAEWPHDHELAAERMEQAVEIAREAFGKDDARVAVRLTDLAFLYAPTSIAPSRSGTDAKKAGRAYEEAARSFAALEDPRAYSEEVIRLAAYMQDFFEET
ncbi:MAG: hypothetical protein MI919_21740, partial [Holophagales bacterium]|nr:hypothetical protein [Holophagales bacterium]